MCDLFASYLRQANIYEAKEAQQGCSAPAVCRRINSFVASVQTWSPSVSVCPCVHECECVEILSILMVTCVS